MSFHSTSVGCGQSIRRLAPLCALLLGGLLAGACDGSSDAVPGDGGPARDGAPGGETGAVPDAGGGGGSDTPPNVGGMAQVKFCNGLVAQGMMSIELTAELGQQPPLRLTAATGTCAPTGNLPCPMVMAGNAVRVRMLFGSQQIVSKEIQLMAGRSYIFLTDLDAMGRPDLVDVEIPPQFTCSEIDESVVFDIPDAGASRDASGGDRPPVDAAPADASSN